MGMGKADIGFDDAADGVFCNLSLKIAAKSARADMVSSLTLANGTSG
jgi:hypothetical protein